MGVDEIRLELQTAIDFLAQKLDLDTDSWKEGQGITQLSSFTVASAKAGILQDVRDALDRSINAGESVQQFMDRFAKVADRWVGKSAWRAQLIYNQNIQQAYGLGRLQQMNETVADRPYWEWRHGGSLEPRPEHKALDGKVFRAEDVTVYPPTGFNCTCKMFSLSQRELDRSGKGLSEFSLEPDEGFLYRDDVEKKIDQLKIDRTLKDFMRGELVN